MKKAILALAVLLGPGMVAAEISPSSDVLLPYFEVDLDDPDSNTVLSVRNSSATAMLANVTVWSDTGYPVLNFPMYFTGYDVVTFALRAMLVEGELPVTLTGHHRVVPVVRVGVFHIAQVYERSRLQVITIC